MLKNSYLSGSFDCNKLGTFSSNLTPAPHINESPKIMTRIFSEYKLILLKSFVSRKPCWFASDQSTFLLETQQRKESGSAHSTPSGSFLYWPGKVLIYSG